MIKVLKLGRLQTVYKRMPAGNMVFKQWWQTNMLPTLDFKISYISLTKADGIGNATTTEIPEPLPASILDILLNSNN